MLRFKRRNIAKRRFAVDLGHSVIFPLALPEHLQRFKLKRIRNVSAASRVFPHIPNRILGRIGKTFRYAFARNRAIDAFEVIHAIRVIDSLLNGIHVIPACIHLSAQRSSFGKGTTLVLRCARIRHPNVIDGKYNNACNAKQNHKSYPEIRLRMAAVHSSSIHGYQSYSAIHA